VFLDITLKNNLEVAKSKCYAFASSTLLHLFFTSNFKNDDKYLALPEIFFAPPPAVLGWLRPWRSQKFWLGGLKLKKILDIILVTFFSDVMLMTSLKWCRKYIFEVRFCHNQLEKPQFGQITELQITNIEG